MARMVKQLNLTGTESQQFSVPGPYDIRGCAATEDNTGKQRMSVFVAHDPDGAAKDLYVQVFPMDTDVTFPVPPEVALQHAGIIVWGSRQTQQCYSVYAGWTP